MLSYANNLPTSSDSEERMLAEKLEEQSLSCRYYQLSTGQLQHSLGEFLMHRLPRKIIEYQEGKDGWDFLSTFGSLSATLATDGNLWQVSFEGAARARARG